MRGGRTGGERIGDAERFPRFSSDDSAGEGEGRTGKVFARVRGLRVSYCGWEGDAS